MEPQAVQISMRPERVEVQVRHLRLFDADEPLQLDCGKVLEEVVVAYESYGSLAPDGANAILVCHALTGSAHLCAHGQIPCAVARDGQEGWWEGIIGIGKPLDPTKHFIVCSNVLGGCYGTTGPTSINPRTQKPYGADFPSITIRDMVRVQQRLLVRLGVTRLLMVIGGSLGGMQVLEWALLFPEMVDNIVPIATAAHHSPWAIALNEVGRLAIMSDPQWQSGYYRQQPQRGLALARMIALISYRSKHDLSRKFGRLPADRSKVFEDFFSVLSPTYGVEQYLRYQGAKLVNRFDANSYIAITRGMDSHDISRGRGTLSTVLRGIQARTLCIGIDSDLLYPADEQKEIADLIPGATYAEIKSPSGHDSFLIEEDQLCGMLNEFLAEGSAANFGKCQATPTFTS